MWINERITECIENCAGETVWGFANKVQQIYSAFEIYNHVIARIKFF